MQLEKILFHLGYGSRKECKKLSFQLSVEFKGVEYEGPLTEVPMVWGDTIRIDGYDWLLTEKLYMILNKPKGYECSSFSQHHQGVLSLFPMQYVARDLKPAGRLDVDTTGLLLLSNDGQFIHKYTSPRKEKVKRYLVELKHPVEESWIEQLVEGVELNGDGVVFAQNVKWISAQSIELDIIQGKYHQVKRMVAAAGNRVESLHRQAVGPFTLGDLKPGQWRYLTASELEDE
jgi:16S rRNA pseudouridine516 synthase